MKTVLIADDSKFMRTIVRAEAEKCGFDVVAEADCSNAAIEAYKKFKPDLVTMDITMTVDGHTIGRSSNGLDAIKAIKGVNPDAQILVVSAMGAKNFVMEAIQLGAIDFVVKPFEAARLDEALMKFL